MTCPTRAARPWGRGAWGRPDPGPAPPGAPPPAPGAVATAIPASAPAAAPAARTVPAPPKPAAEDNRAKAKVEPKAPFDKKETGRFVATYQVASFPGKDQAEAMVKKLAQKGLTASIQEASSNNRPVYRVKIQIKGTEAEITESVRRTGEKGPILLGKKPL